MIRALMTILCALAVALVPRDVLAYGGTEIATTMASKPTNEEIRDATRRAIAKLAADFPRLAEREDLAQNAIEYALKKWDGERPFAAFVMWKADLLAKNAARDADRRRALMTTTPAKRRSAALFGSEKSLREATIRECRERVIAATGDEGRWWLDELERTITPPAVDEERAAARAARAVLKALEGAPSWVAEKVDREAMHRFATMYGAASWHTIAGQRIGIGYFVDGQYRKFGATPVEAAVLSILLGSWPKVSAESTPADVIEREADAIRKASSARKKGDRKT